MYYFVIGAIFKNESHILNEWIKHYLFHGIDHIYLINDHSTDNFLEILEPFIKANKVTLYNCDETKVYKGMQWDKYQKHFMKHMKETFWFGIFDLDEFLYSPRIIDVKEILKNYEKSPLLHIDWVHFGSSGFIEQPENVVDNFLYRGEYNSIKNGPKGSFNNRKSIFKASDDVIIGIHTSSFRNSKNEKLRNGIGKNISYNYDKNNPPLLINHYAIQSLEFWKNIKIPRGSANNFRVRDMQLFYDCDVNDIKDERLKQQNSTII